MPIMTLLELTQSVLSSIESDNVSAINETVESQEVTYLLRDIYYQLVDMRMVPELYEFTVMTETDATTPNYLQLPDSCTDLDWFKYDTHLSGDTRVFFQEIKYLTPYDFLELVNKNDSTGNNIDTVTDLTGSGVMYIVNDKHPEYYTSFDDVYIVCDSYDSAVDTFLQSSKTQAYAKRAQTWDFSDSFSPALDEEVYSLWLAEAKATAWVQMKQQSNPKIEKQVRSLWARWQNHYWNEKEANLSDWPDYGRKVARLSKWTHGN